MSYPAKGSKSLKQKPISTLDNRKTWIKIGIGIGFLIICAYFFFVKNSSLSSNGGSTTTSSVANLSTEKAKPDHLVGRWLRPDGGYILEIRSTSSDGKLDVSYLNPNPIHVAKAAWVVKEGKHYVLVELQDDNYPGSTYGLEYIQSQDRLSGTYFQAVEKNTYDVEFVREQ
jgi:hypothetical protein